MKLMNFIGKRVIAAGVSLILCASLMSTAFGIDINQEYIDKASESVSVETTGSYIDLTVERDEEGNVTDNTFDMTEDITTEYTIRFKDQDEVILNMNGHTLEKTNEEANGSVISANGTDLTVNGLGKDEEGNDVLGTITGGYAGGDNPYLNGNGGGIKVTNGDLTVNDVHLTGNTAEINGSAIHVTNDQKDENFTVSINNVVADYNEVNGVGGGTIDINASSASDNNVDANLNNVQITNNTTAGAAGGLGVSNAGTVELKDVEISNNTTTGVKETQHHSQSTPNPIGGGAEFSDVNTIIMEDVVIQNNKAASAGGGMAIANCETIEMTNTTITDNTSSIGGGMYVIQMDNTTTKITGTNTVIADNYGWNGDYQNDVDVMLLGEGSSVEMQFGEATYKDQNFDGWEDSLNLKEFVRVGEDKDENGDFRNAHGGNNAAWSAFYMTSRWVTPPVVPGDPDPEPTPEPEPDPDPEPTIDLPDEPTPLAELPEGDLVDIFDEDVPLAGGPGTGNYDAVWYVIALLSMAGVAGLSIWERKASKN